MTYRQKLRDPRWQKVLLMVFERDEWRCQRPDCHSPKHTPLAVHHILLPGNTPAIMDKSQKFAGQENFIPVFLKAVDAGWKYCGHYRVETATSNAAEIAIQQRHVNLRGIPIAMVLFMKKDSLGKSDSPQEQSTK